MWTTVRDSHCARRTRLLTGLALLLIAAARSAQADEKFHPTHVVPAKSEIFGKHPREGGLSEGRLPANTPVILLRDEGGYCRILLQRDRVGYVAYELVVPIPTDELLYNSLRFSTNSATELGYELYGELRKRPGNLVYCPIDIFSALALVYPGSAGSTESELATVLHAGVSDESRITSHAACRELLNSSNKRGGYVMRSANRIWATNDVSFRPSFLTLMHSHYDVHLRQADFSRGEATRHRINKWVDFQTCGKLDSLIPQGVIDKNTQLVLCGATTFEGVWRHSFSREDTKDAEFHLADGEAIETPTMHQTGEFLYEDLDGGKFLELPYVGDDVVMILLLPDRTDGLPELENKFDRLYLRDRIDKARPHRVEVFLPKFKLTTHFDLKQPLRALGVVEAFSDDADFSRMAMKEELKISQILHEARFGATEQSVEAAPPSPADLAPFAAPIRREPAHFRADHPFLFAIWDRRTRAPLMMGRVVDPQRK